MPSKNKKTANRYSSKLGKKTPVRTKDSKNPSKVKRKGATAAFSLEKLFNCSSQVSEFFF
jgi:hypothetical protein